MALDDGCLNRREERTAEDGHDESGTGYLDVLANATVSNAVDSREHQRQTATDGHQTVDAIAVGEADGTEHGSHADDGQGGKHAARREPLHQPCADETAAGKEYHGYDIVFLRQHFCCLFRHTLGYEYSRTILYDVCPAGSLYANVAEFCQDTLTVVLAMHQFLDGGQESLVCVGSIDMRHVLQGDDDQHDNDNGTNQDVRLYQQSQVVVFDDFKLLCRQAHSHLLLHRTQVRLHRHGHKHATQGTQGVEGLCGIQSLYAGLFASHAVDVGVATGFKERQSACQNEIGKEERVEDTHCLGRNEHQCTEGVESQAHHDAPLEGETLDEDGCRERHAEITQVEGHRYKCGLGGTHTEYLGESGHHR